LAHLRFTFTEYQALALMCRPVDLDDAFFPSFKGFLVNALLDTLPDLATRIALFNVLVPTGPRPPFHEGETGVGPEVGPLVGGSIRGSVWAGARAEEERIRTQSFGREPTASVAYALAVGSRVKGQTKHSRL
jgi:hypothetical protein